METMRPELKETENGLSLIWDGMTLTGDFRTMLGRVKPGRLGSELLIKAAKYDRLFSGRPLTAFDATAGLGEDSFLLAAAGFNVVMFEKDHLIFSLLEDALGRAMEDKDTAEIASRMKAVEGDFRDLMRSPGTEPPDIIYLDPMFPARKKSGLIKKKFQILQQLEPPETDEGSLIGAAFGAGPRRIIVKRPLRAPVLGDRTPDYSIKGGVIRYDCFILRP